MVAVKRAPRGKPFSKGDDPRRNPAGRPRAVATAILRRVITEDDLESMWLATIKDAIDGDKDARRDILDRLEGKAVARNESGDPGDFDADLSDVDTKSLKAALKRVK